MHLKQSDLFLGMGHNFLKETMAISEKVYFNDRAFIFREGEPTNYFYIIIKGKISLLLGDPGQVIYTTSGIGELFGCSSLLGRNTYFVSAQCMESSVLLSFDQQKMNKILYNDIDNSILFFKQLAATLGNRLMQMYQKNLELTPTAIVD
ncbi:MAG: cyclic nucleotide-binding domain-containing protein [Desulfobacteraceae bacterium]|nr:cyclic nucleotide-binding domain-containing protein [Desulfobacteraceae bacterium]MBC2756144.1 cyclic nucleotide-binding domain-containing protein [Desulfobacteraceae bacterium]